MLSPRKIRPSAFSGEWENPSTIHQFSHDGRVIWSTKKERNGTDYCTAVDSYYGTETQAITFAKKIFKVFSHLKSPLLNADFLLGYFPLTTNFGCLVCCESKIGLRIVLVRIDFTRSEFLTTGSEFHLNELGRLCSIPEIIPISSSLLAVQIIQIDTTTGLEITPQLYLLKIPCERDAEIRLNSRTELIYGPTNHLCCWKGAVYYFPIDSKFSDIVRIESESSKLMHTDGFPGVSENVKVSLKC